MSDPKPFAVNVPDEELENLHRRLALARFPSQLESSDQDLWDFGVPSKDVQRLTHYWRTGFDWRKAEAKLNELPQYRTDIEVEGFGSLDIHCMLYIWLLSAFYAIPSCINTVLSYSSEKLCEEGHPFAF